MIIFYFKENCIQVTDCRDTNRYIADLTFELNELKTNIPLLKWWAEILPGLSEGRYGAKLMLGDGTEFDKLQTILNRHPKVSYNEPDPCAFCREVYKWIQDKIHEVSSKNDAYSEGQYTILHELEDMFDDSCSLPLE